MKDKLTSTQSIKMVIYMVKPFLCMSGSSLTILEPLKYNLLQCLMRCFKSYGRENVLALNTQAQLTIMNY